ncbi:amidohydrolase family protein [Sphingobium nicotianae]|uniref:Amidohydrolase family protein n=1 Tax=Sphingobium nicotianae TaxID=2782607 RepID=A0A9X1IQ73_9SPHN|nr:amidohydrolase family protein [Sphingobium nicotianae]MBT2186330.1 amidohydrolase family protein [Sphingobium nicotianae]
MSDAARYPIYDSHAHLVSDDPARYPRKGFIIPRKPGPSRAQLPPFGAGTVGIAGGMHGPSPTNEKPTAEQMHAWMAEEGVVAIAAVQKGMIYGTDNSYIMDAADLFPDEMRAVIIIDPLEEKTLPMIRDGAARGIIGIRFFPVNVEDKAGWLNSPEALEVWQLADELELVVDIEGPKEDWREMMQVIEQLADRFPRLRIVLDHVYLPVLPFDNEAGFSIDECFPGLAARDNITYKFTCLNMDVIREQGVSPAEVLRRLVDHYGADKIMWGSDIGTSSGTYKDMVARAIDATALLTDEERRKVLHDTGRRVFTGWAG